MLTDLVSLIETIGPAFQRSLVFNGTNFKDTLFDHPSASTNTACTHLLASSMDRKGAYLANGSFLISTVCRHCPEQGRLCDVRESGVQAQAEGGLSLRCAGEL
jgi:hypothetical protein